MNLQEIEGAIYDRLNYQTTPDSLVIRRIRRSINLAHRQLLGMRGLAILRRVVLPCVTTANSPYMVMPQALVSIAIISDRSTRKTLDSMTISDLRFMDPGVVSQSGNPYGYSVINWASPVALDPAAASELFVASDSATDGSGQTAYIEGVTAGGYYRRANIPMSGSLAVSLDSTITDWLQVRKFYLSSGAAGTVTLQSSGGTVYSTITPGRSSARYTQLHLTPTPSTALTYYVDGEVHVDDLTGSKDEPLIPEDFHELLVIGPLMREYSKREKPTNFGIERNNWVQMVSDLKAFVRKRQGVAQSGSRQGVRRFSQLGSNFPAGS